MRNKSDIFGSEFSIYPCVNGGFILTVTRGYCEPYFGFGDGGLKISDRPRDRYGFRCLNDLMDFLLEAASAADKPSSIDTTAIAETAA